jgi:hypothetical protein
MENITQAKHSIIDIHEGGHLHIIITGGPNANNIGTKKQNIKL